MIAITEIGCLAVPPPWYELWMFHLCSMSELASGIVSTALQCGTGRCPTDDLQLDTPVRITIEHSDTVKVVTN